MKSRIYTGTVMHARHSPVEHRFSYPLYWYVFDLDELDALSHGVRGFSRNRINLVSLRDRDYLRGEPNLQDSLKVFLGEHGRDGDIHRVELVTAARFLGYVFNPVSFYYCYGPGDALRYVIAEVNNTFGERHLYILDEPTSAPGAFPVAYQNEKQFHVSPFNDMRGAYDFSFSALADTMRIGVTLRRDDATVLTATLDGKAQPLTSAALTATLRDYPLVALKTTLRIAWQALRLRVQRRLPVFRKPAPEHRMTIGQAAPSRGQRVCMGLVRRALVRMTVGRLLVTLPDGTEWVFDPDNAADAVRLHIRDYRFFTRVVFGTDIGLGESFVDDDWRCDDLTPLLRLLIRNISALDHGLPGVSTLGRIGSRLLHLLRPNSLRGSRRNIHAHYDLGNDFYHTFLDDETLFYSCGIHDPVDVSLAQAQRKKVRRIIELAQVGPEHHVLEIGCGWGGFAIEAARATGCRVTGITLSDEQLKLARERVKAAGLEGRVSIIKQDYRKIEGTFDRIVSIEMLEAVGHRYYGAFFSACDRALKPGGRVVLQAITIPDQRYAAYRRQTDWIQKYIFPGGMLPSLTELGKAMTRRSALTVEQLDNIGPHYASTLAAWRERFTGQHDALIDLGYDETFQRMWRYYLSYSEAGFAERYINVLHLVLTRPGR